MEMKIKEIERELQQRQGGSPRREEEKQEHLGTKRNDEQNPNAAFTKEEEMEIHQQRVQIYKLKEKTETTYQVTQIAIDKRPRLQKLQNMFQIKVTANMANKAMEEILDKKDLNITEQNHLIYAAETIIIGELNDLRSRNNHYRRIIWNSRV
jgi:hypothetical protein